MKTMLAASLTGLALLSGSALAADLPPAPQVYKAPAVVAPAYNWSGCYSTAAAATACGMQDQQPETSAGASCAIYGRNTIRRPRLASARPAPACDYQVRRSHGPLATWPSSARLGRLQLHEHPERHDEDSGCRRCQADSADQGNRCRRPAAAVSAWPVDRICLAYTNGGYRSPLRAGQPSSLGGHRCPGRRFRPRHTYNGWFLGGGTETSLAFSCCRSGLFLRSEYRFSSFSEADLPVLSPASGRRGLAVRTAALRADS